MIPRRVLAGLGAAALAALVAPALSAYPLTLLTQAAIIAILAMSLDVLLGYTGLPSLGHAAYFGIAAYAVGILTTEYQCSFLTCLVSGVALAALTAAVFGLLAIRASGTYFLMITLALGMVVWGLAFRWVSMTKGDNGIAGVPRPELGLPWSLSAPLPFFYFALAAAVAAPTPFKLDTAKALGVDQTILIDRADMEANRARLLDASGADGYDYVVEATGSTEIGNICVPLTRNGGTVLVYGVTRPDETVSFHPFDVFRREITIKGSFAEMTSFGAAIRALRSGRARTDGIITHRFSLDDYGKALDAVARDRSAHKVVIVP